MSTTLPPEITLYNNHAFNKTTLSTYNLTFYASNNTLSNDTKCYYIPSSLFTTDTNPTNTALTPSILTPNGTFVNPRLELQPCSSPVLPLSSHGILGLIFGCLFIVCGLLALINLRRFNGHIHIHTHNRGSERRRRRTLSEKVKHGLGRRRVYTALLTSVLGCVTCFMGVDVDRDVVVGVSFEVQCGGFAVLAPLVLVGLGEECRWFLWRGRGVWREIVDEEGEGEGRGGTEGGLVWWKMWNVWEGVLAVSFYVLVAGGFFVVVVRDWGVFARQWYPEQTEQYARAAGLSIRFSVGSLMLMGALGLVVLQLCLSCRAHMRLLKVAPELKEKQERMLFALVVAAIVSTVPVTYSVASSYSWSISPYNALVSEGWFFGAGIAPVALALLLLEISRLGEPSTQDMVTQTRSRNLRLRQQQETKRPSWWRNSISHPHAEEPIILEMSNIHKLEAQQKRKDYKNRPRWWQGDGDQTLTNDGDDDDRNALLGFDAATKWQEREHEPGQDQVNLAHATTGTVSIAEASARSQGDVPASTSISETGSGRENSTVAIRNMLDV